MDSPDELSFLFWSLDFRDADTSNINHIRYLRKYSISSITRQQGQRKVTSFQSDPHRTLLFALFEHARELIEEWIQL